MRPTRRFLPQHFKQNGHPKRAYTEEEAVTAARKQPDQKHYKCRLCSAWHLGHR